MLNVLEQILFSFISSFAFGIIFNVPRRALMACGIIGVSGWVAYWTCRQITGDLVISIFLGSVIIGVLCIYYSKKIKIPVIILNIPALIPLVPGAPAYMCVRVAVEGNYIRSIQYLMDVIYTAGAIVFGFMIVKVLEKQLNLRKQV